MTISEDFLISARRQFLYYKTLGEKAMEQLDPDQLFISLNEDTNSIAVIVKHLQGNMLSRWTDFLTTDGEKEWRNRDEEFCADTSTNRQQSGTALSVTEKKALMLKTWNEGWDCLFNALNSLKPEDLSQIIYIRNEGHTVLEAINRQLAHYPYHIGQIVFYAKLLKKSEWDSLSIPKNKSKDYNADKFSKDKTKKHFTDDELKKL
ncbi:MAG: DinB superfamily protein [Bacteroidota bacterium]|jgi:hypothetical protein|nr:DinB superfamily protein [Bacteroidota bacterium]